MRAQARLRHTPHAAFVAGIAGAPNEVAWLLELSTLASVRGLVLWHATFDNMRAVDT